MSAPMTMARTMATTAASRVLTRPPQRNLSTDHLVNGSHLSDVNWPLSISRMTMTTRRKTITAPETTDTMRTRRRPLGPRASASTCAVTLSPLDRHPSLDQTDDPAGGERHHQVER